MKKIIKSLGWILEKIDRWYKYVLHTVSVRFSFCFIGTFYLTKNSVLNQSFGVNLSNFRVKTKILIEHEIKNM